MSSPTVRYSLARLGLFLGASGLLYLLGLRSFLLIAVAIVTSGVLSYFLLTVPRVAMGVRVAARWRRRMSQFDRQARAEDEDSATPFGRSLEGSPEAHTGSQVRVERGDPGGHVVPRPPHQAA